MRKIMKYTFIFVFALFAGCTTAPPLDFTVESVGMVSSRKNVELVSLTVGFAPKSQQKKINTYALGRVMANQVPSSWKEALQDAINRSLIFIDDADKKINLSVRITEFTFTGIATVTATVTAIYEIVDRKNGDLLFAQEISAQGVVPVDFSFYGDARLAEAYNRAVRNNIAEFISTLEQLDLSKPVFEGS